MLRLFALIALILGLDSIAVANNANACGATQYYGPTGTYEGSTRPFGGSTHPPRRR
jgi:hypothetical protein